MGKGVGAGGMCVGFGMGEAEGVGRAMWWRVVL